MFRKLVVGVGYGAYPAYGYGGYPGFGYGYGGGYGRGNWREFMPKWVETFV